MLYMLCAERKGNTVMKDPQTGFQARLRAPARLGDFAVIFSGQPYISIKVEHANHKPRGQQQQSVLPKEFR